MNKFISFNYNGQKKHGEISGTYLIGSNERLIIKTNNGDKFIIKKSDVISE